MTVNATKNSVLDIRLPLTPEQVDDDKAFKEFQIIYAAIRSLQAGAGKYLDTTVNVPQYTTANAPAYKKGAMYFDTTLNKLRVGGATAWETVTSV